MFQFSATELANARRLIDLALLEDLGQEGDITSVATIPANLVGRAVFASRSVGTLAGREIIPLVAQRIDTRLTVDFAAEDGQTLNPRQPFATIHGPMRSLLAVERTALNFLQRLSGIASLTHQYVSAVNGTKAQVLDTRKTTPGWRLLEKYAVKCGGGTNHRIGLYDAILIKDNHLAAIRQEEVHGDENQFWNLLAKRLAKIRDDYPGIILEIEVDSLEQFERLLPMKPDIILLDNMSNSQLQQAVDQRDRMHSVTLLEASGGVNLQTIAGIAATGVDRISVGALTHSAKALDIGLDYQD